MGYNFLYGLWKYSWDADCDLFLRILKGEVKEDVYLEQINLQVAHTLPPSNRVTVARVTRCAALPCPPYLSWKAALPRRALA